MVVVGATVAAGTSCVPRFRVVCPNEGKLFDMNCTALVASEAVCVVDDRPDCAGMGAYCASRATYQAMPAACPMQSAPSVAIKLPSECIACNARCEGGMATACCTPSIDPNSPEGRALLHPVCRLEADVPVGEAIECRMAQSSGPSAPTPPPSADHASLNSTETALAVVAVLLAVVLVLAILAARKIYRMRPAHLAATTYVVPVPGTSVLMD